MFEKKPESQILIIHGSEKIKISKLENKNIAELKEKIEKNVKDQDFWLEYKNKKISFDSNLNEIFGELKICYSKKYCELKNCRLKQCKIMQCCRFCSFKFCAKHKMPEEHFCNNFKECKQEANDKNAMKLEKGKVERNKI